MRAACYDCGLPYSDPGWVDCVLPNDVWAAISPTGDEGGLLCLTCMTRLLVNKGFDNVPIRITSGPYRHDAVASFDQGFVLAMQVMNAPDTSPQWERC